MPFRATVASRRRLEVVTEQFPGTWSVFDSTMAATPTDVIYVMRSTPDWSAQALYTWSVTTQTYTYVAGGTTGYVDGTGASASFGNFIWSMVWNDVMNAIVVADDSRIRVITPGGVVTTLAGDGLSPTSTHDGTGTGARFGHISAIAVVPSNGNIVLGEYPQFTLRVVTPLGVVTTLAGPGTSISPHPPALDGTGSAARFGEIIALAVFPSSGVIAVVDTCSIRLVTPSGVVTTLAGNGDPGHVDGPGTIARFATTYGSAAICILPKSEHIVLADGDIGIRLITKDGFVTTLVNGVTSIDSPYPPYSLWPLSDKEILVSNGDSIVTTVTIV